MSLNSYSLPQSWIWSKLESVAEVIMGQSPPGDSYNNTGEGVPLINGPVEFGAMPFSKTIKSKFTTQPTKYCKQDDLILCVRGSTTGRINIAGFDACIGRGVAAIRSAVLQTYINFLIHALQRDIYDLGTGSTFPNVSSDVIKQLAVPLAPLNEQHRIVEAIETHFTRLDAAVAALKRAQNNLKRYRSAVLKAACEGRLVPTEAALAQTEGRSYEPAAVLLERILAERRRKWEAENPGKPYKEPAAPDTSELPGLPEGWCWGRIKQLGHIQLGRQRAPQHHTGSHMRPYLRVANVFEDHIDITDIYEMNFTPNEYVKYQLKPGDILLNEGQSPEFLGRPAIYRDQVPGACFQNTLVRYQAYNGLIPEYALIVFRNNMHSGRFRKISQITTNIAHLSAGRFAEIEFPFPPLSEQSRIVAEVERRLSLIDQLEKSISADLARAERLRQSILKRAFEGKLVPQDPNDEPAAVLLERIRAEKDKT